LIKKLHKSRIAGKLFFPKLIRESKKAIRAWEKIDHAEDSVPVQSPVDVGEKFYTPFQVFKADDWFDPIRLDAQQNQVALAFETLISHVNHLSGGRTMDEPFSGQAVSTVIFTAENLL
jgi:hypothetical protein